MDLCTGKGGYLRGQIPGTLAFGGAVLAIMGFSGVVFETPEDWEAQKVRSLQRIRGWGLEQSRQLNRRICALPSF